MGGIRNFVAGLLGLGGYEAAAPSNRRRRAAAFRRSKPQDEDSLTRAARTRLRLEAHDLDRNQGMLFGVCNRIANYAVPRINCTFATADKEWNRAARAFLARWFRRADVRLRDSFPRLVWTALRSCLLDGDGAFLLLDNGQIKPVEAECIVTPTAPEALEGRKIVDGVELDGVGRAVAYWFAPRDAEGYPDARRAVRQPASRVVFWRFAFRFDQVRGTPPTAPILTELVDENDLHVSYLEKTRNDTRHAAVSTMTDGGASMPGNLLGLDRPPPQQGQEGEGEAEPEEEDAEPGFFEDDALKLWTLRPGEDVRVLAPGTPGANIVEYEKQLVRRMSAALGIPAEFWTLDLRGLSWSTANAVVKIAGDKFRDLHEWAAWSIIRPVLDWRILMAIRDGDLPPAPSAELPGGLVRSRFDDYRLAPPEYLWAAEKEHYEAARLGQQLGLPVMRRLAAEVGMTFDELLEARKQELIALYAAADEVSRATGAAVSISQFTDSTVPGAQQIAPAGDGGEDEEDNDEGEGK